MTVNQKKGRIFYFDAIRALAIIGVIVIHLFARTYTLCMADYSVMPSFNWFSSAFLGNFFRIGVDLFFMLSGALLLGREWGIKSFLGKRIPRIALPFLFWCITLSFILILLQFITPSVIHTVDSVSLGGFMDLLILAYSAKSFFTPNWFFWTILGIYLIMPVFNKWLLHSDLKEAEYFLCFWLITCLFDATLNISFPIKLTYFTSPIGFVVLGYYLRHTKHKIFTNLYFPIVLIIVMGALEIIFSYLFSTTEFTYTFDRYSIIIALEATGVFLLFRNLDEKKVFSDIIPNKINSIFKKSVESIAKYSYGIYLIHNIIMFITVSILKYMNLYNRYKLDVLILFIAGLFGSWIIMALLNRIKYVNSVIGAN